MADPASPYAPANRARPGTRPAGQVWASSLLIAIRQQSTAIRKMRSGESSFTFSSMATPTRTGPPATTVRASFRVNEQDVEVEIDTRESLLDVLRERLELTGTKKGCDHGQCGA